MKGLTLLFAAAALGVDTSWEAGPGGQLYYTLRVEQVLLEPLRNGQAIVSTVDANDRNLRRFQVMVGDKPARPATALSEAQNMVQYGWRPGQEGGIDFMIQVSPERLEALAGGTPLRGEVAAEVSDIRRIYFFAGVDPLPRELPDNARAGAQPTQFLQPDEDSPATPATRDDASRAPLRNSSPSLDNSSYPLNDAAGSYGSGLDTADRYRDDQDDWRHSTPANSGSWSSESSNRFGSPTERGGSSPAAASPYAAEVRNRGLAAARFAERGDSYAATEPVRRQPLEPPAAAVQPPQAFRDDPLAATAGYTPSVAPAAAAGPLPAQAAPPNWQQAYAAQTPVAAQAVAPALAPPLAESPGDAVRPWTPLILTTLALFASLGANAYLGWLAWSFFWRYREAANDAARVRA